VSVLWNAAQPVTPSSARELAGEPGEELLDRTLHVADPRLLRGLHRRLAYHGRPSAGEQARRGGDDEEDVGAEADGAHGRWLLIGPPRVRLNTSVGY
jgi:hypothetical protein